jgi:hypothetical protein
MGREGRRRKQLLDTGSRQRKHEVTLWRIRCGRGCGSVVRHTLECVRKEKF